MAKFKVMMFQTVLEETTVTIEADTIEEAKAAAHIKVNTGDVVWEFYEVLNNAEIQTVSYSD